MTFLRDVAGLVQEIKPIVGFVGLFERDVHFADKIGPALGMVGLPDERADAVSPK